MGRRDDRGPDDWLEGDVEARRMIARGTPEYAVVGIRRARVLRRAGMPTPALRSLSPRWNDQVVTAKFDCLPPIPLAPHDTVVDVGANIGDWAEAVLALLRPTRLIAFEPTPESGAVLRRRFSGRPEVEVRQCGVGEDDRKGFLYRFSRSEFNSLLPMADAVPDFYGGFSRLESVEVPMTRLDDALVDVGHISVLHLDVQGFEPKVIKGASEVLARTTVVITVLDFVTHYQGEALFAERDAQMADCGFLLHDFGYQCHDRDGRILWAAAAYRHC